MLKMGEKYQQLVKRLADVHNLDRAAAVLGWDQQTQMPPGGAAARAVQLATVTRLGHEIFTSDETARLIEDAASELAGADYDSDEASLIRVVREDYEDAVKLPAELVAEISRATTMAHEVWAKARQNNNFQSFLPALEPILDLHLRVADYIGYDDQPYDALIDRYERGITTARVKEIFDGHKPDLIALIAAIGENESHVDDTLLHQPFDIDKQREFALDVIKNFGFDFHRGLQAVSVHPFCTHFSRDDVRLTTRFNANFLNPALFGMMHEAGHGMYEQGSAPALEGTPLSGGTSLGVHESQSRMWENLVGRSKGFWSWALPRLKQQFPGQLDKVDLDTFYKAINKVQRSFIRVEADEATYNLHIMLRFDLETDMMAGKIKPADLPEEWNDRFESFFGITPPTDTLGVLQDVHWSMGLIGYFATYALGNLLSVQYYNKAVQERPSIPHDIANGKFDTLLTWLNEHIHKHGRKYTSDELTRRVTGESIQSRDYIHYLQTKYGEVYDL
jgi:carboxypeptidase Taq